MAKLTIEQWYARAVAAGIMPDWDDIWVWANDDYFEIDFVNPTGYNNKPSGDTENAIQLRKDGVDLVELEWIKPTKEHVGLMGWIIADHGVLMSINMTEISDKGKVTTYNDKGWPWSTYCVLLANNGNIAPKPEDFHRIYGD